MTKPIIYLISLLLIFSGLPLSAAPQLKASIEPVQVAIGETLRLTLELSGISNQDLQKSSEPDLTPLQDIFTARGQHRFDSSQTINGVTTYQVRWQYTLEPQKTGTLTIPALSLATSIGHIFSQPLTITVNDARSQTSNSSLYIEATISNNKPYLYQPVYYTIKLYHYGDLRDPEPIPPANDVILEQLTSWSERREQVQGKQMVINEMVYLLTPLKSGKLELVPSKVKALKPDSKRYSTGFGFSMFTDYLPIVLTSSPLTVEVQPPVTSQQPWLPVKKLQLEQTWQGDLSQPVVVGVPLVRALTLTAEGMGGQPLPDLEGFVQSSDSIRIRSPKPDIKRRLLADGKTPVSELKQNFSVTPLTIGTLQLPAIRLPWWDVEKNVLSWAELPAQTLNVIDNNKSNTVVLAPSHDEKQSMSHSQPTVLYFNLSQYLLLITSIIALLIALVNSWYHRYFLSSAKPAKKSQPVAVSFSSFKQNLLATEKLIDIKRLIQEQAHIHWQISRGASLLVIAQRLVEDYEQGETAAQLLKQINSALYGNQSIELSTWKSSWITTMAQLKQKKLTAPVQEMLLEPFNYR